MNCLQSQVFFRGKFTSAINGPTMACVQWIPFILDKRDRTTFIGRINARDWNTWSEEVIKNQFISTTNLQPSRYALAYTPLTNQEVYINVAFIALDAENLCEINDDNFTTDFGDNKFPYYKGRANQYQQDEIDESDEVDDNEGEHEVEIFEALKSYLPPSVLRFLLDPDPLRFINHTL